MVNGQWGAGTYKDRQYSVRSDHVYFWEGQGFNLMGTRTGWESSLKNKVRMLRQLNKNMNRRLDVAAPTNAQTAGKLIEDLAQNADITLDVNKLLLTMKKQFAMNPNAALIVNMSKEGQTFFCSPDVMNFNGWVTNQNYCAPGLTCNCQKRQFPGASIMIRTSVGSFEGVGKYAGRVYPLRGDMVYKWNGDSFEAIGLVAKWIAALDKNWTKRSLSSF